jgi:hypothetical protein
MTIEANEAADTTEAPAIPDDSPEVSYDLMKDRAIIALLTNTSHKKAAESIGVSAKSLTAWSKRDDFMAALQAASRRALNQALGNLSHCCAAAVGVLHAVANDQKQPGGARVAAAKAIIETSRAAELSDISERLRKVERQLPSATTINLDALSAEELAQLEALNSKMRGGT